jgi:UDP-N-acetylglucosamine--dolichyl-phosphate N-acetylglucosaminephosphotransferase
MAIGPRPLAPLLFFGLVPVALWFVIRPLLDPLPAIPALYSCFGLSIFAFLATLYLVPTLGPIFIQANLKGRDLLKSYKDDIEMLVQFLFQESQVDFGW